MDDTARREHATRRTAASVGPIAAALALVAFGTWGRLNPGDLVWVDRLLDHVVAFGVVAVLLGAWGLGQLTHRRWVQVSLAVTAVLAAGVWTLVGSVLLVLTGDGEVVASEAAPDAPYAAVVRSTSAGFVDPAWVVSVRQTDGATAREFEVGCLDGDDPRRSFRAVRWIDAERLEVSTSAHTATVTLDPETGEPEPVRGRIWGC